MMVKIETILQFEEVQGLLERAQGSGAVDTAELNAVLEALELDSLETEALRDELEQHGIELVERLEKYVLLPKVSGYATLVPIPQCDWVTISASHGSGKKTGRAAIERQRYRGSRPDPRLEGTLPLA
jgi:Sigma-70 factor, region 1.1